MKIPILRIGSILMASIQIDLNDAEALEFQDDLIRQIAELEATGVAIDITAMDIVDSYMARVINDTVNMAKLMGAEVVICGIQPLVAMTLVEMGRDLLAAECKFNLEQGLRSLNERIAQRGDALLLGGKADGDLF